LPFLAFSIIQIVNGTNADGKWFCLFLGLFMGWLLLEFVATREEIAVDWRHRLSRAPYGACFRKKTQLIDLKRIERLDLESEVILAAEDFNISTFAVEKSI